MYVRPSDPGIIMQYGEVMENQIREIAAQETGWRIINNPPP